MAWPTRPTGLVGGDFCAQLEPFHTQVSLKSGSVPLSKLFCVETPKPPEQNNLAVGGIERHRVSLPRGRAGLKRLLRPVSHGLGRGHRRREQRQQRDGWAFR
jgi:hypothetical protein